MLSECAYPYLPENKHLNISLGYQAGLEPAVLTCTTEVLGPFSLAFFCPLGLVRGIVFVLVRASANSSPTPATISPESSPKPRQSSLQRSQGTRNQFVLCHQDRKEAEFRKPGCRFLQHPDLCHSSLKAHRVSLYTDAQFERLGRLVLLGDFRN